MMTKVPTDVKISSEAIEYQLQTIKSIISPTIAMFKKTGNIDDIQPNLEAIHHCVRTLQNWIPECPPEEDSGGDSGGSEDGDGTNTSTIVQF